MLLNSSIHQINRCYREKRKKKEKKKSKANHVCNSTMVCQALSRHVKDGLSKYEIFAISIID